MHARVCGFLDVSTDSVACCVAASLPPGVLSQHLQQALLPSQIACRASVTCTFHAERLISQGSGLCRPWRSPAGWPLHYSVHCSLGKWSVIFIVCCYEACFCCINHWHGWTELCLQQLGKCAC